MHVPRGSYDHSRVSRQINDGSVEGRALINLPKPLPSIPLIGGLLDPILTPIIDGPHSTAAPAPSSSPSTGTGSGNDNGSGNGDGSGSSGDGNGDGSSGGSNDGGNGDSGSDNGGSSNGNGSSGGNSSSNGGATPTPTGSSNTSNTSSGSQHGSSSSSGSESTPTGTNPSTKPNNLSVESAVSNAGSDPSKDDSDSSNNTQSNGGSSIATKTGGIVASSGSVPTGTTPDNTSGIGSPNTPGVNSGSSKGLSSGAIAAIVIVVLALLLALIFFILRRRSSQLRKDRRARWWNRVGFGAAGNRDSYHSEKDGRDSPTPGFRASFRSSFATTVDHAQTPRDTTEWTIVPPLPPVADADPFRRQPSLTPIHVTLDNSHIGSNAPSRRESVNSLGTTESGAQYLYAPPSPHIADSGTPMSVRPFSPSESFAFPAPPKDRSSATTSRVSLLSSSTYKAATPGALQVPVPNPFADPASEAAAAATEQVQFNEVEVIRRPFSPTRPDELRVSVADNVKVLQVFDDGWAVVERLPGAAEALRESYSSEDLRTGLIPMDCFRPVGQDLSSFFDEKRVSSLLYTDSTQNPFEP